MTFMEEKRFMAEITVEQLSKVYNGPDYRKYREFVSEKVTISSLLKQVLLAKKRDEERFSKNVNRQEELLRVIEEAIFDKEEALKEINQEFERILEKYEEAKKLFDQIKKKLQQQKQLKAEVEETKEVLEKGLLEEKKRLTQMKQFTLVHPSANLTSLDKKGDTTIVLTKYDTERMHFDKIADCIIDTEEIPFDDNDIPQDAYMHFMSSDELESAIEYAKLVLKYWAEDKPYNLLYNSEGIGYILRTILK